MDILDLIKEAYEAKKYAYVPYSGFHVGAALLTTSGKVYRGCNIENAAYSPTNCAERTAFFKAISEGETDFQSIVVVGDKEEYLTPCGVCRQVMMEFCNKDFQIIAAKNEKDYVIYTLEELYPASFSVNNL